MTAKTDEQERAAFEAWLGVKPCGAAHDFAWEAWKARAVLNSEREADVAGLVDALEQGFPLLSDDGLDEVEHHCEWVIQRERKRVHSILAAHRNQWQTFVGCDTPEALADEVERLRQAISLTLEENGHLADGDVCTLSRLKVALQPNT